MDQYTVAWPGQAEPSYKKFTLDEFFTRWVSGADQEPFEDYMDFKKAIEGSGAKCKKDGADIVISNLNGTTYTLTESGVTEGPVSDLGDGE